MKNCYKAQKTKILNRTNGFMNSSLDFEKHDIFYDYYHDKYWWTVTDNDVNFMLVLYLFC
jgi:hypothetical protein